MMFQYNAMCISLRVQRYNFFIRFSFNSGLADEKKAFFFMFINCFCLFLLRFLGGRQAFLRVNVSCSVAGILL